MWARRCLVVSQQTITVPYISLEEVCRPKLRHITLAFFLHRQLGETQYAGSHVLSATSLSIPLVPWKLQEDTAFCCVVSREPGG